MKGKPHPRNWEAIARRVLCWLYEAWKRAERAEARAEIAENENEQLRKELRLAKKAIQEMVSHNRKVEQTWMNGVAKNPTVN